MERTQQGSVFDELLKLALCAFVVVEHCGQGILDELLHHSVETRTSEQEHRTKQVLMLAGRAFGTGPLAFHVQPMESRN